ncbi:MAG: DMT family transporter [Pseudomonadota bacterium]
MIDWQTGLRGGLALLAVLAVGVLWGLNWPTVKFLLNEIPPLTIRAMAFPFAALLLAIAARAMGQSLVVSRAELWAVTVTGLFLIFGFNVLTVLGQTLVQTSRAAIIAYTMPAMTAVLAAMFLSEQLRIRQWFALAVGMGGLGVLLSEDIPALRAAPIGPLVMALAALSWAIGNVTLKARVWKTPPIVLTVWFFGVSTLLVWPLVLAFEPPARQTWPSVSTLWVFGFHVVGPMVTCYLLWTLLVARLPATVAAISTLTAPIVGVGSSIVLLTDPPTWQKGLALAMVVISIAMTLSPGNGQRQTGGTQDER